MTKFGGKSTRRGPLAQARKRGPVPVPLTGRTSVKGDRSGLKPPAPRDAHLRRYHDGSLNTKPLMVERDKFTGRLSGIKIAPCRGCGHTRAVQVATGLCSIASCARRRILVHQREVQRRRARDCREGKGRMEEAKRS